MQKLLEKWSQLEPNKITVFGKSYVLVGWLNPSNAISLSEDLSPTQLAILQAAVQEAIEARGWEYELRLVKGEKIGYVYPGIPKLFRHDTDNPAESLLRAYLKALEAARAIASTKGVRP